jgi:hypothetical protein
LGSFRCSLFEVRFSAQFSTQLEWRSGSRDGAEQDREIHGIRLERPKINNRPELNFTIAATRNVKGNEELVL